MAAYGNKAQTAKQTYGYRDYQAPAVSRPALAPYSGPAPAANSGALYPSVKPVQPVSDAASGGGYGATPTTPTKTTAPTPAQAPAAAPQAAAQGFDPNTDPVYQMTLAQTARATQDAQAASLASQRQLGIQYGDADLLNRLGDSTAAQAASENPYSIYGQLRTQQPKDALALDENLNKNNLFYSGARVNQQSELSNQYGQQRALAAGNEQSALGQIQQALIDAQNQAQGQNTSAYSDAYNRFLTQLLASLAATPQGGDSADGGGQEAAAPVYTPAQAAVAQRGATAAGQAAGSVTDFLSSLFGGAPAKPKKPVSGYSAKSGSNLH